jgi:hypothetical protein
VPLNAPRGHLDSPLSSSPPRHWRTDNAQLACPPRDSHCRYASAPHERTLALPSRRAVTSLPHSWRSSHCFHAMHNYKRRPSCCISSVPAPLSTSGKPSAPCSPLFSATSLVPSHLTPPLSPCAGPGASPEIGFAPRPKEPTPSPSLSYDAVDRAGELHNSVAHPPHCELVLSTVSGRCAMVLG